MRRAVNPVTLLASGVGLFGIIGPNWLLLKENRLVQGEAYSAFALPLFWTITLLTIWVALALPQLYKVWRAALGIGAARLGGAGFRRRADRSGNALPFSAR